MFEHAFSLNDGVFDRLFFDDITAFLKLVMLRREKDSPSLGLSIPNKMEFILSVPLSELQRSLYLKILTGLHQSDLDKFGDMGSRQKDISRWAGHQDAMLISPNCPSPRKIKISQNMLMELRKVGSTPMLAALSNINSVPSIHISLTESCLGPMKWPLTSSLSQGNSKCCPNLLNAF
jgi:SWI/SNF-related matrix-associated actin-dependent regulator of chromatin subfamily A member 5